MTNKHLTSLEALGIAIRSEIDAQNLYEELGQRIASPAVAGRAQHTPNYNKQKNIHYYTLIPNLPQTTLLSFLLFYHPFLFDLFFW